MSPRTLAPLLLVACWKPHPGPAALDIAEGPVATVGLSAQGPATWVDITVRAGSAHDPVGKEGLAWLSAQMLREGGAGDHNPQDVDDLLFGLGTDVEVIVGKELVSFRVRALHDDLDAATELVADMLLRPQLDADTFERLRAESADYLERGVLGSDEELGLELLDTWLYTAHPYGHPARGRSGTVPTLTLDDVRSFVADRYVRPAVTLGMAGPAFDTAGALDPAAPGGAALQKLSGELSTIPARLYSDVTPRKVPSFQGRSLLIVEKSTQSTGVHFGHPHNIDRGHADWPALALAFTALGEHRQGHGRLYQALRGARGLNYGDYAYIERYTQAGWSARQQPSTGRLQNPFYVWLRPTAVENGPFALRAAIAIVEDFVEKGLAPDEFATIQKYLGGRVALWATDPGRRLGWATEAAAMGWPDPIAELPARIEALTLDEVNAAIRTHIDPANLRIVVVTGDAAAFQSSIESTATPIVYASDPPAEDSEQAAQDALWAAHPLALDGARTMTSEEIFR